MNKIRLSIIFLIMVISSLSLTATKIMLITIPKSGTHLLHKCLSLIDREKMPFGYKMELPFQEWYEVLKPQNSLPPPDHWKGPFHPSMIHTSVDEVKKSYSYRKNHYSFHTYYTEDYNNFLDAKHFKKILLLRDPRAVLVSFANMVKDGFEPHHKINFEDLLLDLIDGRQQHYISWAASKNHAYPVIWEIGLCAFYRLYLPFIETKNCLTLRFENLVGKMGGGSAKLQRAEIAKILKHLNMYVDDKKIEYAMSNLFGDSTTFNQGTIDGWKKHFTPRIKAAFKAVPDANKLLVLLGYEKNLDW